MKNSNNIKKMYFLLLLLVLARELASDAAGYAGNKIIFARNCDVTVIHWHNWTHTTRKNRLRMFWGDQNPFTTKNDYAYIECVNNETHDVLFKTPSPALTYLFVNEDSRYILGLSNIKLNNPFQLVLLNNFGKILYSISISPNEAKLNKNDFMIFCKKFPKETRKLKDKRMIFTKNDSFYINYRMIPLRKKVRDYLFDFTEPSHFSKNFSESETNFIDWYMTPDPCIQLRFVNGKVSAISLLDPAGERFEIPLE